MSGYKTAIGQNHTLAIIQYLRTTLVLIIPTSYVINMIDYCLDKENE